MTNLPQIGAETNKCKNKTENEANCERNNCKISTDLQASKNKW